MNNYRPICDMWILARSKVKYYGAYPAGFLGRARDLMGVNASAPVLHVCGGRVKDYPFRGLGPNDETIDLDMDLNPTYLIDVREEDAWAEEVQKEYYHAALIDRPYSVEDAEHYPHGTGKLPDLNKLLATTLQYAPRVGVLDYFVPRPPKGVRFVACVGVIVGFGNRIRAFTVFEREE